MASTKPISTPRTITSNPENADGLRIPIEMVRRLRSHLTKIYPDLGKKKPFSGTRLCWYNDSPDDDWIIGRYPTCEGVFLATAGMSIYPPFFPIMDFVRAELQFAGSGHAYKFLPVIGGLIADIIEDKASPALLSKFAFGRKTPATNLWGRASERQELDESKLCTEEDLQVHAEHLLSIDI